MNLTREFLDRFAKGDLSGHDITVAVNGFTYSPKGDRWPEDAMMIGQVTKSGHPKVFNGQMIWVRLDPDCMDRGMMLAQLFDGCDQMQRVRTGTEIEFQNCVALGPADDGMLMLSSTGYNPQVMSSAKPLTAPYWSADKRKLVCHGIHPNHEIVRVSADDPARKPNYEVYSAGYSHRERTDTDLSALIASVDEAARQEFQIAELPVRVQTPYPEGRGPQSPWGPAQYVTSYADNIWHYECAGHGGFLIAPELNETFPPALRRDSGWYEEDCDWSMPVIALRDHEPAIFTEVEITRAERVLRNWHPDAWEAAYGRELKPGESGMKDRREREASTSPAP